VLPWNAVPGIFILIAQTSGVTLFVSLARRFLPVALRGILWRGVLCGNPYALLIRLTCAVTLRNCGVRA